MYKQGMSPTQYYYPYNSPLRKFLMGNGRFSIFNIFRHDIPYQIRSLKYYFNYMKSLRLISFLILIAALLSEYVRSSMIPVKLERAANKDGLFLGKSFLAEANISLSNYYNVQYSGIVYIGSNNQSFNLIFDTGSPWMWVPQTNKVNSNFPSTYSCSESITCNKCPDQAEEEIDPFVFNICNSNTTVNETYSLIYSSGVVTGTLYSDKVRIGDSKSFYQSFLVCEDASILTGVMVDGICGLSLQNNSTMGTLLQQLKFYNVIENEWFSLYLTNNPDAYGDNTSVLILGGYDPKYAASEFINVEVFQDYIYWQAEMTGLFIGNNESDTYPIITQANSVIYDSGTSNIVMLWNDFMEVISAFKSNYDLQCDFGLNNNFACACPGGSISAFPNLEFEIGGYNFTLPPSLYLDVSENVCSFLIEGSLTETKSQNESNITNQTYYMVLGDVFLRNYYTVFFADNYSISFAEVATFKTEFITTLELIYLIMGTFILVMFAVFLVCLIRTCTIKGTQSKEPHLGTPMIERPLHSQQYSQMINDN